MKARNKKILLAALDLFARYGVGKTTMNDIARQAGVARQTLYNAYPGKDEVLRAAVQLTVQETFASVESAWDKATTLDEKLGIFFEHAPLRWYDMVQSSPDAADLLEGLHTVAKEELAHAADHWTRIFTRLLIEHAPHLTAPDHDPAQIADFIYSTSLSAKHDAGSRAILEARLAVLKASVLAMIQVTRPT